MSYHGLSLKKFLKHYYLSELSIDSWPKEGPQYNLVFQNCRQPLHWACSGGHRDVVAFILNCCLAIEGTIDVNTPDDVRNKEF
jgi:hypothetical protein